MNETAVEWDFFLSHAGADQQTAESLYGFLVEHSRVFLDSRCLRLGDDWDAEIAKAQRRSLVTVVLISAQTERAHYQREEIAAAIAFAREHPNSHRVVPIYLDNSGDPQILHGLRVKHGIALDDSCSLADAASRLLGSRRSPGRSATVPTSEMKTGASSAPRAVETLAPWLPPPPTSDSPTSSRPEAKQLRRFVEVVARGSPEVLGAIESALESVSPEVAEAIGAGDLVQLIQRIGTRLERSSQGPPITDSALTGLIEEILASPGSDRLGQALEGASLRSVTTLNRILLEALAATDLTEDQVQRGEAEHRRFQDACAQPSSASVQAMEGLLLWLEGRDPRSIAQTDLEDLRSFWLSREVADLLLVADSFCQAAIQLPNRPAVAAAVDFSELFAFCVPFQERRGFDELAWIGPILFELGSEPVYLPPGTVFELSSWIRRWGNIGVRTTAEFSRGYSASGVKFAAPIARLTSLVERDRLAHCSWPTDALRFGRLRETCARAMDGRYAYPTSIDADAQNVAFMALSKESDCFGGRAPLLISRDKKLRVMERAVRDLANGASPITIDPLERAVDLFFRDREVGHMPSSFDGTRPSVGSLAAEVQRALRTSSSVEAIQALRPTIIELTTMLQSASGTLLKFFAWARRHPSIEAPFQQELRLFEEWKARKFNALLEASDSLAKLADLVSRFEEAYQSFAGPDPNSRWR